jgi:hypothetical protein
LEHLSPFDRATVHLWDRSYAGLSGHPANSHLIEAAVHAVLAGLRQYNQPPSLFTAYEMEAAVDVALIRSLVPSQISDELLWTGRDAAFHLCWVELMESG